MEPVLELLRRRAGLVFPDGRRGEIDGAVERAMRAAAVPDVAAYVELLSASEPALDRLISACTVGESYFFREPEQLEYIRREVVADLAERRPSGSIRVWSAGCASGEEAYSLAILLRECGLGDRIEVVGTDVARDRLARARRGHYRRWSLRGAAEPLVRSYFRRRGAGYELVPEVRSAARFRYLNLAAGDYPSSGSGVWEMDLILCRNVLIYLDRDALPDVARRLYSALAPGGWLFLAASDPSLSPFAPFETVMTDRGLAYRRPLAPARRSAPPRAREVAPPSAAAAVPEARTPRVRADPGAPPRESLPAGRARAGSPATPTVGREPGTGPERVRELADRGLLEEAGLACAAALEEDGPSAELLYLHSLLLGQAGHHAEAAAAARRALYLQDDLVVAHLALGTAAARLDDAPGARRAFEAAVRLLSTVDPADTVPGSGGEPAGRLLELARAKLRLVREEP
ncbi:MAG: protein-glutamate O-methyltransferase CheR [Gemmatimonadetes bacterium]|nr:protein-glutamate O-methyltransferase CheR [Gemmatimonadota bacterium]